MTAPDRFDFRAPRVPLADLGATHLIAIGGAGMSAVARVLMARGIVVSGSDAKDSRTLQSLRDAGAHTCVGHEPAHVDGAETVVISSAIRDDNVELVQARARGLRVLHRSQALAALTADRQVAAVAGANGKTTTTSMLVTALDAAGLDPSFAAGGEIASLGTNARWGQGEAFVVEADESDGSFVVYHPQVAIVTNVQPDHLDYYGTFARVQEAYAEFVETLSPTGLLVACADDEGSAVLAQAATPRTLTYGMSPGADVRVLQWTPADLGTTATLRDIDGTIRDLRVPAPGAHNVLNAAAAYTAAVHGYGADPDAVLRGLAHFSGARRRFEVIGRAAGVTVVDDYAHNAGKVQAVVGAAAAIAHGRGARVTVLFQPHLYSRTRDFAEGFATGLAQADRVGVLDIYGAREDPMPGVTSDLIGDRLRALGVQDTRIGGDRQALVDWATSGVVPGDLLLLVGAGDVTELGPGVLARLGVSP
ncbi:MAG: UDP-N-acetylmuramate--L-alanine ligase [Phycicoccus sp.]|nr:UDP-N-acetylmuramate--L-alanine ligase [Phycicoccus sp.]